jgi:hypothetical protein
MNTKFNRWLVVLTLLSSFNYPPTTVCAQGTAFTYQGRLNNGTNPATGSYDLRFYLYNDPTAGSVVAGPITNTATAVTNGLFTTTIDFGNVFSPTMLWLHVGVRTNGGGAFTGLLPRQQLTPTPYAVFAEGANAAGLSGTIPAGDLTGVSGSGLTGLNASQLTGGTVPDAVLASDVALTDANQTFTGINTFSTGTGNGRLTIAGFGGIDTSLFTGLGFQYYAGSGEGAIMSSYNDGFGYLSFYTKQGNGYPITKKVIIDNYGGLAIDQQNANNGFLNNGTTNGVGLTFGLNSGEGIASDRQAGGNQYGLDFYTDFASRMSILQNGFVGIGRQTQVDGNELFGLYGAVTNTWRGMFIETGTGGRPFYGYSQSGSTGCWTEQNGQDGNKWELYNSGFWLTVMPSGNVGVGTTTPAAKLEVNGDLAIDNNRLLLASSGNTNYGLEYTTGLPGISYDGPFLFGYNGGALGAVGGTVIAVSWDWRGNAWVSNNISTGTLTIRGGADLAEPFNITSDKSLVPQGAVVVIDEQNPGHLKLSDSAYDTRVAGVVSGANGVNPGIQMHQQGMLEGGQNVALTGRVYVQADASNGAIRPGDMLTTSSTPGHAMKVSDHAKAAGAILGKAMTGLSQGQGMVLVLVTLQ